MAKFSGSAAVSLLAVALAAGSAAAAPLRGSEYLGEAKISLAQARTAALKAVPGKITDEELEKEQGGSGLRYSFDVLENGVTHEVGIDAVTGALLENSLEGAHPD